MESGHPGVTVDGASDLSAKPAVTVQTDTAPPAELVTHDLVEGDGAEISHGDTADVQYVGVSWSTGNEFDSSWDRGAQPFSFPVGAGGVIGPDETLVFVVDAL
jgi:peptidylprolyl isomerase